MLTRRRFLAVCGGTAGTALGVVAGVRLLPQGAAPADGPPAIQYGAEKCAACGMIIDDPRFAAAWTIRGGGGRRYDDIGCMVTDLLKRPAPEGARMYVHDLETEAWLAAAEATYLISPAIRTPMAYGLAAVATQQAADRLATQYQARVQPWPVQADGSLTGRS